MSVHDSSGVKSRGRSVLLIVSLCLNVALIAMIVAGIANAIRTAGHPRGALSPESLLAAASNSERRQVQAVIDAHAERIRVLRTADLKARKAALGIFEGPVLDPFAFKKALDAVDEADGAVRKEEIAVIGEAASKLSASERKAIAGKAQRRFRWWLGMHRYLH